MPHHKRKTPKYWFPAKRYGWGWGLPSTWQGWVTFLMYVALIVTGAFIFPPDKEFVLFLSVTIVLSVILIVVCWMKGEPPRWRWGDDKRD